MLSDQDGVKGSFVVYESTLVGSDWELYETQWKLFASHVPKHINDLTKMDSLQNEHNAVWKKDLTLKTQTNKTLLAKVILRSSSICRKPNVTSFQRLNELNLGYSKVNQMYAKE